MKVKKLKLVLGDQLDLAHSWFEQIDDNEIYVIAELMQEATYTQHHVQKVCAFFLAMEAFAAQLNARGHNVLYLTLDDTVQYTDLCELLVHLCHQHEVQELHFQQPDEFRLRTQLLDMKDKLAIPVIEHETEHFLLSFHELSDYFQTGKHVRMESFYRKMRRRFDVLIEGSLPVGGNWNYDKENRNALTDADIERIPPPLEFENDAANVLKRIASHGIKTIGKAESTLVWAINRTQGEKAVAHFINYLLPNFGKFQDAMTQQSPHAWSLYHSRLSFLLNSKIISPRYVIDAALRAYEEASGEIGIAQIEGFIRQIIGWREYVRGMYWVNMPSYSQQNYFKANRPLPHWYWNGKTQMSCLQKAISQSLDKAYAHHIQRLMVTGNFALLAGIDVAEVDAWYLGIYIDAIEWVELPNTRGMALFADGGWIATKPYIASGNYINKMSDYCKGCRYNVKEKTGANACPLNSLYWNFIDTHLTLFEGNQRMRFPVKTWQKMSETDKQGIREYARRLLNNLNDI